MFGSFSNIGLKNLEMLLILQYRQAFKSESSVCVIRLIPPLCLSFSLSLSVGVLIQTGSTKYLSLRLSSVSSEFQEEGMARS
jgi:hypothetical protein